MVETTHVLAGAVALILAGSGAALAGDDCYSPMAQWQPRAAAAAHARQLGIDPGRLRIDDGCYQIRGRDSDGNKITVKLDPATLALMELDVTFRAGADPSRYLPGARGARAAAPADTPNSKTDKEDN